PGRLRRAPGARHRDLPWAADDRRGRRGRHARGGGRGVRRWRPAQRAALPHRSARTVPDRWGRRRSPAATAPSRRDQTRAAIHAMTAELLDLYARRQLATGYAFPSDTPWQRELESAFLYEDTPDQRRASDEVKRDMERARPMDRLLVGDVGYGKTE